MTRRLCALGTALALALALLPLPAFPGDETVRLAVADPVLDRNGDGFQDLLPVGRAVHHDVDFDGRFDYTLTFAFKEYTPEGHRRYIAAGYAPGVFEELTRAGLDALCASERVAANWTAEHFRDFSYYHDGYGRLQIFDDSPENDGRLAGPAARPGYAYSVAFNPDGTVASVQRGGRTLALATFDYETNTTTGTLLRLPAIRRPADLAAVREQLDRLFAPAPQAPERPDPPPPPPGGGQR
jgi:hypothetical protein